MKEKILIIDDEKSILRALYRVLRRDGYEILQAENGEQALHLMRENGGISVIICDYKMPGQNGVEVLRQAMSLCPDASRILLTASTEIDVIVKAINIAKVSYFLHKPWDNHNVQHVVKNSVDYYQLLIENRHLHQVNEVQHRELEKAYKILQQEVELGGKIQDALLLGKVPGNISGITIKTLAIPSRNIDGDFYDFYRISETMFDLMIGDVMGKGIPAALVGTAVKTQFIRFALPFQQKSHSASSHIPPDLHQSLSPRDILTYVEKEVTDPLMQLEYFITLFYCRFDVKKLIMTYVDCGSAKPIHYQSNKKKAIWLKGGNFPLGLVERDHFVQYEINFSPGDLFVFYSDGVTEAQAKNNHFFGEERLLKLVKENACLSPQKMISIIYDALEKHCQSDGFNDDVTLIVIRVDPSISSQKVSAIEKVYFTSNLSQLDLVQDFISRYCARVFPDPQREMKEIIDGIVLAVNEAFVNIIRHGYKGEDGQDIIIEAYFNEDSIRLDILDKGIIFDPRRAPSPDLTNLNESGMGIYMIREVMDSVDYTSRVSSSKYNRLTMIKNISKTHTKKG